MDLTTFDPNGVGVDTGNYFGLSFTPEESELVLLSAPWDVTVSYGAGTAFAPDAIIAASTQLDLYDGAAHNLWQRGIATAPIDYDLQELSERLRNDAERVIQHLEDGGSIHDDSVIRKIRRVNEGSQTLNENLYAQASKWLDQGKLVGLVGGDHSTPFGVIRALADRHPHFGILHIDAHCDLREAYEGFEFSHASIMYNVLKQIPQVEKIVQVGVRDFCDAEYELGQSDPRLCQFEARALDAAEFEGMTWREQCDRIIEQLPHELYISFDVDGLSPENCPHTGTPVPGGLSYNRAIYLLERLASSGRRIIGFDLVEVTPSPEDRTDEIVGARLLYKLCGLSLKSQSEASL